MSILFASPTPPRQRRHCQAQRDFSSSAKRDQDSMSTKEAMQRLQRAAAARQE